MMRALLTLAAVLLHFALGFEQVHAQSGLMPQNSVWAGPTSGGQGFGQPRALVPGDLPTAGNFNTVQIPAVSPTSIVGRWISCASGINFNSANTDNAIPIALPSGFSRFYAARVQIQNASASITTATAGVFGSTGGAGAVIAANQALTVTTSAANTNNNSMILTLTNANTEVLSGVSSVQFRIGTAQGSAATADACIEIIPAP
jgi:hypothetical protein